MTTASNITQNGAPAELSRGNDTPLPPRTHAGLLYRLSTTWNAAINFLVPIGYEDETGFHYGEPFRATHHELE